MNVRISFSAYFYAGIYFEDTFLINNYKVTLSLVTLTENNNNLDVGLDRIKHFIYNCLTNSVFIHEKKQEQCKLLNLTNIKVTTLPLDPYDQVIGLALHTKLNSILEDQMFVTDIEISSTIGDDIVYHHADDEGGGPFENEGWWLDPAPVHFDIDYDDDKVVSLTSADSWTDLNLDWDDGLPDTNPEASTSDTDDNLVVFPDVTNGTK